ncbi:MAG: hypothetical protein ACLVJH_11955 [Faecalibacterium prausnitzii]
MQRYPAAVYAGAAAPERFELPGMPWGKVYRRELFAQVRFPAYYTCFEDAIIHFLVFRLAKTVASVPEMVYLWRKNPKGLTATSQHHPAAVQSYWIMEQLAVQDAALETAPRCAVPLHPDAAAFGFLLCHRIRPAAGNAAGCFPAVLCFVRKGAAARGRTAPPCPLGCPGAAAAGLWAVVPLRQKISVVII